LPCFVRLGSEANLVDRNDCPFCAPHPERVLLKNPLAIALWDGFPVSPGHALVVPRRHVADWFDTSPDERLAILELVDAVKEEIDRLHEPAGYNVGINIGEAAGQTIFHLHVHVIPRYEGDIDDPRGGIRYVLPDKARYWES
jgi:diadenosine tetraphosphate (Ap4A) HIT family hydrolase